MKIIWSVDLFGDNNKIFRKGEKLAETITSDSNNKVLVTYVASPNATELSLAFDIPVSQRLREYPLQLLKKKISDFKLPKKLEASIVTDSALSVSSNVKTLLQFAKAQKAHLIMLGSQSRQKVIKFVFGSFAETLVQASEIDVLLYREDTRVPGPQVKRILFLHDFSEEGDKGFLRAAHYAKLWKCELSCLHIPGIFYEVTDSGAPSEVLKYKKSVDNKAKQVEGYLKTSKLNGRVHIASGYLKSEFEEKVRKYCKKANADLVVMGPQKNRLGFFSTSKARKVMATLEKPLLLVKM